MSVGRNELCPCGSGKKYKKCCGVVTPIEELRALREQRLRKEYAMWIDRLNRFVAKRLTDDEVELTRNAFAEETNLPLTETVQEEWNSHFLNWLVFDKKLQGATVVEEFLATDGRRMDVEAKEGLHKLGLDAYEVISVENDVLTVHHLGTNEPFQVVGFTAKDIYPGHILLARFLSLGTRHLLFSGSLIMSAAAKTAYKQKYEQQAGEDQAAWATSLYALAVELNKTLGPATAHGDGLIQRVYKVDDVKSLRGLLENNTSFELKKEDDDQEIWVFAAHKEEFLIKALDNTLLELHEVTGEIILLSDKLVVESLSDGLQKLEETLNLDELISEKPIGQLSSTGKKLTKGTIFITSQPMLPPSILQWAMKTYFAEKWLLTPHQELSGVAPVLAAASDNKALRDDLAGIVAKMEKENESGQGMARFMRFDIIRPRLAMENNTWHISRLLQRPIIEGLPESFFTVQPARLEEIATFVKEMTEGKSESTIKKYDETMNLFRTFVRCAFGPHFNWDHLSTGDLAYFLVHDVLERTDSTSKTMANNLLSVLAAFFKWLEKNRAVKLQDGLHALLSGLKEDLPEVYRLRQVLQKAVVAELRKTDLSVEAVREEAFIIGDVSDQGVVLQNQEGQSFVWKQPLDDLWNGKADWLISGLFGLEQEGAIEWKLYGTPELYPPAVAALLGARLSTLVP